MAAPSSQAPFADPIVHADAELRGRSVTAWSDAGASFVLLDGDVTIEVGSYGFVADRCVVRIDQEVRFGVVMRHLSMYLDRARPLRGRGRSSVQAARLLVTATTTGELVLTADSLAQAEAPVADVFVEAAAARTARYFVAANAPVHPLADTGPLYPEDTDELKQTRRHQIEQQHESRRPQVIASTPSPPSPPGTPVTADPSVATTPPTEGPTTFVPPQGVVYADAKQFVYRAEERTWILYGGITIAYEDTARKRTVQMRCGNAVVMFAEGSDAPDSPSQFDLKNIKGIYLEENVIVTDGQFTVRAPRVYYDPVREKAIVLDAVFYTWDVRHKVPIYVRAERLRQVAHNAWTAEQAIYTTSEFAEPHFSIASPSVRFEMREQPDGTPQPYVQTDHFVPQVGNLPVGYMPGFSGSPSDIPLRRAQVRYDSNLGPVVTTRWDVFGLLGRQRPEGVSLDGQLDYLGDHGPAMGLDLDYDKHGMFGSLDSYLVALDNEEDDVSDRQVDHEDDTRGFFKWQHKQDLGDDLELSIETAYVSDETFLEEFDRGEADTAKPYETSFYLKHQRDDEQASLLAQYDLMNFTPQTTVLQSPGYTVEKLPELGYYRVGTSLLDDRLTYFTENRASRMRLRIGRDSPADRGFNLRESMATFALPPMVDFDTAADAAGIPSDYAGRFDTRHEIQAPMKAAFIDVTPYVVGRATTYDDDFDAFAGENDRSRLWGMLGTRLHTTFSRTYDHVENELLNVHRLRHIVEPSVDFYAIESTIDSGDLPIYDPEVEGIRDDQGARIGLRNTLETQRGGPGRWRNVEWVVVNTDVVFGEDEEAIEPARFFSYRPEYSTGGDHFYSDLTWMLSDMFALTGDVTHSFDTGELSQWHSGVVITHTPRLSSYIDYDSIDPVGTRILSAGLTYQLTKKYRLGVNQRWDLDADNSRRSELILERKLPRWTMLVMAGVDEIDDDQSIGILLIPDGIRSSRRLSPFGR